MPSHVTEDAFDEPKIVKCSVNNFYILIQTRGPYL